MEEKKSLSADEEPLNLQDGVRHMFRISSGTKAPPVPQLGKRACWICIRTPQKYSLTTPPVT
jgi:hypothetical protein